MTDLYECPADGCNYGPKPKTSVLGHFSGKQGSAHEGGYEYAKAVLGEPVGQTGETGDKQPKNDTQTDKNGKVGKDAVSQTGGTPEPSTPTFPSKDSNPDSGSDGQPGYACPECDSQTNVFDSLSVLDLYRQRGLSITQQQQKHLENSDAACVACGVTFDVAEGK